LKAEALLESTPKHVGAAKPTALLTKSTLAPGSSSRRRRVVEPQPLHERRRRVTELTLTQPAQLSWRQPELLGQHRHRQVAAEVRRHGSRRGRAGRSRAAS